MKRKIFISLLFCLFMPVFVLKVYATGDTDYVTGNSRSRLPIPKAYVVTNTINNIGDFNDSKRFFKDPQDIYIDSNDFIYIADTGNNRIVKMDSEYKTVGVFYGPVERNFSAPEGVFVDKDGDIYVADTGNSRIVHLSSDGTVVEIFTNPEDESVGKSPFNPSKLVVSDTGYIYVVRGENIMAIDGNNVFRGLYGQTNIGYNFTEVLIRIFASEQQQRFMTKRLASSYLNIDLGEDGLIYAVSLERVEGEVKRLNSVGTNTYRKYKNIGDAYKNPIIDYIEKKILKSVVAGRTFKFGEYFDDNWMYMEPIFRDIAVDSNGIVTILTEQTGKLYQYDQEGSMLAAFGGLGEQTGKFTRPSSIAVDSKGYVYVLDRSANNIQAYMPTEFIKTVQAATTAYNNGQYDLSLDLWSQVLSIHENYELAHAGIAKAYYKQEQWKNSMDESKKAENRDVYTKAFDEYKYEVLRENFVVIVLLAVLIITAVFLFLKYSMRAGVKANWSFIENKKKMTIWQGVLYSYNVLFHPIDTIEGVRYNKKNINLIVPVIVFIVAYVVRVAYIYIVHYPLASIELRNANIIFEAVSLLIVPLSWIPAVFMVTSISDGESKLKELFFTAALAMLPFIFINTPLMFISNIMSKSQQSWYGVFSLIIYIWMILIMLINIKILNDYSISKTIRIALITLFVMLIMWVVVGLIYVLSARLFQFASGIILEIQMSMF